MYVNISLRPKADIRILQGLAAPRLVDSVVSNLVSPSFPFSSFIDRGEYCEVYQGTATDILEPETGQTPVAVKVCLVHT